MYKKILVVGPSGSGKSTLSRELRDILHLPLYHLDNYFWTKDKKEVPLFDFYQKLLAILAEKQWIIDGDYSRSYELRIKQADTVIFLDYPLEVCLEGVRSRIGKKRDDIPWVEESFDPEFEQFIISSSKTRKEELLRLLDKYQDQLEIIILNNREEAQKFLKKLREKEK